MSRKTLIRLLIVGALGGLALGLVYQASARHLELPTAILEEAPYNTGEAVFFPPPWESAWEGTNNPGKCSGCHTGMFDMWNGSMMSNSWRDPLWRSAFFLLGRATATDGNCDIPNPPDGTPRALLNPFANGNCTSTFDLGTQLHTTSGSGSLLDEFCSACHMPTNYIDNVAPDGSVNPAYDPTSAAGTPWAYATVTANVTNTDAGKRGIFCKVCHSMTGSRQTPYHNYNKSGTDYTPALGTGSRDSLVTPPDILNVADAGSPNLGYSIGARAYKLSPHAIGRPERFGPLTFGDYTTVQDSYIAQVFGMAITYEQGNFSRHDGFYSAFMERSEWCGLCHDVTNPLPIKNPLGLWTGSFPIERTYTEWRNSRYADRPANPNYDPNYKRDCQTCHMQQSFGQPGTAQTLYAGGVPVAPLTGNPCDRCTEVQVFYTHHFVGGNAYVTRLIGADVSSTGSVQPYPELSNFSFSSADETSIYHRAYFENVSPTGPRTQHARMAWDRLRNALTVDVNGPTSASAGTTQGFDITVANTGCGHNFPTGFPEGRNGWLAVRAFDTATGAELQIQDSFWGRTSLGVGYLTAADIAADPNFPGCNWHQPAGAPDPYAYQFRAVASLGDGCPTLALPYATPLNVSTDPTTGMPVDAAGNPVDRANPGRLPEFNDLDGDGDLYDNAYLVDTRLRPMPHSGASLNLSRYSVIIPPGTAGPVALTAQVYYQSAEAVVARELLGNLADLDMDRLIEPCTLGGACDGRMPSTEPAVVEGAPPVPMEVGSWVINVDPDTTAPSPFFMYPMNGDINVYDDVVVKIGFCEPVTGIDATTFTLVDGGGLVVPASVDQISDGVWGLFPHDIFLPNDTYTATVTTQVCDFNGHCLPTNIVWSFTTSSASGTGNTQNPVGFGAGCGGGGGMDTPPSVTAISPPDGATNVLRNTNVVVTFSEPVTGVDQPGGFALYQAGGNGKNCNTLGAMIAGMFSANGTGDVWTFDPNATLGLKVLYCVQIGTSVMDLDGTPMALNPPFASSFKTGNN